MSDIARLQDLILRAKTADEKARLKRELMMIRPKGYFKQNAKSLFSPPPKPSVYNTGSSSIKDIMDASRKNLAAHIIQTAFKNYTARKKLNPLDTALDTTVKHALFSHGRHTGTNQNEIEKRKIYDEEMSILREHERNTPLRKVTKKFVSKYNKHE